MSDKSIDEIRDYVFDWCEANGERGTQKPIGSIVLTREANTRSYIGVQEHPYMIPLLFGVSSDSVFKLAYIIIRSIEQELREAGEK
jgi:hypothetical protein